jgi:hypothetical protein
MWAFLQESNMPSAVNNSIRQDLFSEVIQPAGGCIPLDLLVPYGGVEFLKPAAKSCKFLARQFFDLLCQPLNSCHG